jgi:tyrosyl-tRNA synthetase
MWFTSKTKVITDDKKINQILSRGVEDVFVKESLVKKLKSGKKLRIKFGIDPTSPHVHIGRAVPLRKLKAFQELGHQVILLVGDFTAQIGDASDKLQKRPMLSGEIISNNLKTYISQISKILDIKNTEIVYNKKWLSKLSFAKITELAEAFSVSQMISRRNFSERLEKGDEISLRELLYPLMQGYDSVVLKADIEIGGFDQLFNLKAGRIMQKHCGMPEQDVFTVSMLEGTDGRKMSSSWGNIIAIDDEVNNMYGKVMALKDELIAKYFLLATDVEEDEIEKIKQELTSGINPKEIKMRLASEIVTLYHGVDLAVRAQNNWIKTFSDKEIPTDIQIIKIEKGSLLKDILVEQVLVSSKSEFTRLVGQGAIQNMSKDEKVSDINTKVEETAVYKVGKKQFIKIEVK